MAVSYGITCGFDVIIGYRLFGSDPIPVYKTVGLEFPFFCKALEKL
jgi:hypothetical protein